MAFPWPDKKLYYLKPGKTNKLRAFFRQRPN